MPGKKLILTVLTLVAMVDPAFAIFGVGDVVSDPMSYTYYVEQIKMMTDELAAAQDRLDSLNGIKDQTDQMRRQLIGTYNTAIGAIERIKKLHERSNGPTSLKGYAEKWEDIEALKEDAKDGFIDARKLIDAAFKDPRSADYDRNQEIDRREQARQVAIRGVIIEAEEQLDDMPARYAIIENLINQIDQTENVKHAMDLNNRIQVEILEALLDLVNFTTKFGQAQALQQYSGASDEGLQREIDKEDFAEVEGMGSFLKEIKASLVESGIDPDSPSDDDFKKIMGIN